MESDSKSHIYIDKIKKYNNSYVIFYSKWCKYSIKALEILQNKKLEHRRYDIEKVSNNDFNYLLKSFNRYSNEIEFNKSHKTRPIIFYKGKFIGGCSDLEEHLNL